MNAYYTTNNGYDAIVIPAAGTALLGFTSDDVKVFLNGASPDFENWVGEESFDCSDSDEDEFAAAEKFGVIVAQRVSNSLEARFLARGAKHDELMALMYGPSQD